MSNNKSTGLFASGKPYLVPVLFIVMLLVALLYLGLGTDNYNGDGLGYANQVETASSAKLWSYSARLLYCPTGRLLDNALGLFGIHVRAVYILQVFNSVMGFLGVGVFLLAIFRLTRSIKLAALAALGLAFTFNFWFWNINVTSYPGNVFFLLCCFFMLVTILDTTDRNRIFLYSAVTGLFHALACFYWLTAMLLAPSIALGIMIIISGFDFKKRLAAGIIYGVSFMVFLFVPLLIAAAYSSDVANFSEFRTWLFSASHGIPPRLTVGNFLRGIIGFTSSVFRMTELGPYIKNVLFGVPFVLKSAALLIAEIAAFVLLWVILAFDAFSLFLKRRELAEKDIRLLITFGLWALPPVIFGLIWLGSDTERWLAVMPVLWMFLLLPAWLSIRSSGFPRKKIIGHVFHALVVILFCYNLVVAVIPDHDPEQNYYMKTAEALNEHMTDKDLAIIWGYDNTFTGADLTYFFRKDCIHLGMFGDTYKQNMESKLVEKIDEVFARGGRVYINGRLFLDKDLPESRYSDDEHVVPLAKLKQALNHWQRREAFTYKQDTYWELY